MSALPADFVDTVPNGLTESELDASIAWRQAAGDAAAPREVTLSPAEPFYPPIPPEEPLGWRDALWAVASGLALACCYVMTGGVR